MIESVQKVVEQLVTLLQARQARLRRLFEDHVSPIYSKLNSIVSALEATMDGMQTSLRNPTSTPQEIYEDADAAMRKEWHDRWETTHYAFALRDAEHLPSSIGDFAQAVQSLFYVASDITMERASLSLMRELGRLLHDAPQCDKNGIDWRRNGTEMVEFYRSHLNEAWKRVSEQYHKTRVQCLR
jgi:hypothetical protein